MILKARPGLMLFTWPCQVKLKCCRRLDQMVPNVSSTPGNQGHWVSRKSILDSRTRTRKFECREVCFGSAFHAFWCRMKSIEILLFRFVQFHLVFWFLLQEPVLAICGAPRRGKKHGTAPKSYVACSCRILQDRCLSSYGNCYDKTMSFCIAWHMGKVEGLPPKSRVVSSLLSHPEKTGSQRGWIEASCHGGEACSQLENSSASRNKLPKDTDKKC